MNFFEHQDQARRNTTKLLALFGLSIVVMILAFYGVALGVMLNYAPTRQALWQPDLLGLITVAMVALMVVGSATKFSQLSGGGQSIAEGLGGRRIDNTTGDLGEQRLINVVSEMALASGTPIPAIYVLDQEAGINAFAAGHTPEKAVIGVTRGCLDQLTRDELQGVIGHEFSHILNGDMGLNLKLIAVIHGLLLIYITGRVVLRLGYDSGPRRRSADKDKGEGMILIAALSMVVIGYLGVLGGRLIKSAVGREREFLADASAVQFTRNPQGIADALRKIGQLSAGSNVTSPLAETASHLFFGEANRNFSRLGGWFATHPPLQERIRRLGQVPLPDVPVGFASTMPMSSSLGAIEDGVVMGFQSGSSGGAASSSIAPDGALAAQFVTAVGTIDARRLAQVRELLEQLPADIKAALQDPGTATDLVFALLVRTQPPVQAQQIQYLTTTYGPDGKKRVGQLYNQVRRFDQHQVALLIEAMVPALKQLSPAASQQFFQTVQALAHPDGRPILAGYAIQLILRKRLQSPESTAGKAPLTSLDSLWPDAQALIAMLARVGHNSADDALYAFKLGLAQLPGAKKQEFPHQLPQVSPLTLTESLDRLGQASPKLKQAMVDSCAHTVLADNTVTPAEMELLRAVVITLDCPAPPFLG